MSENYKDKWDHVLNWIMCQLCDVNLSEDQKNAYSRVLAVMVSKEHGKPLYSEVIDGQISRSSVG